MIESWWIFLLAGFACWLVGTLLHIWNMRRIVFKASEVSWTLVALTFTLLPAGSITVIVGIVLLILWLIK